MGSSRITYENRSEEVFEKGMGLGLSNNQASILSGRVDNPELVYDIINPLQITIPPLNEMSGMDEAAKIIHEAVSKKERIAIVTDYDSDGVNSAIVIYLFLKHVFQDDENIVAIINKRTNGNGITAHLLESIIHEHKKEPVGLVITADHGSANGSAVETLREYGIKTVVTDHHKVPDEGHAGNADAFVNPQKDPNSPFKKISGCAVAYYTMLHTMRTYGYADDKDVENICMAMVGIATIGDSMNMSDSINRYLVTRGLNEMNSLKNQHWVLLRKMLELPWIFDEEVIGFSFVPMINATSRISDPREAFEFYLSEKPLDIERGLERLNKVNKDRRKKQNELMTVAMLRAEEQKDNQSIVLLVPRAFGINGIISGFVGEKYHKPIITFVQHGEHYEGSARGIVEGFSILEAFNNINASDDSIFVKYGGHDQAAGATIHQEKLDLFKELFEAEAKKQIGGEVKDKMFRVVSDLEHKDIHMGFIQDTKHLGPYGIGFVKPEYSGVFFIKDVNCFGKDTLHARMTLMLDDGRTISAMMFNASNGGYDRLLEDNVGKKIRLVFNVALNNYGGMKIELRVSHAEVPNTL